MNFQFYLEKLFASDAFQNFMKEQPEAVPVSAFFIIDRENKKNPQDKQHFDYYVAKDHKMFSFKLEEGVKIANVELLDKRAFEKIAVNYDFDLEAIEKQIEEKMKEEKNKSKITKLLFSMQHLDGKDYLVGTIFLSMLGMLKIHYDIEKKEIVLFEKKSFFDMVKIKKKGEKDE